MKQKIGIIGLGNMGSAFYQRLETILPAEQLFGYDKSGGSKLEMKNKVESVQELIDKVEVVILAVKPQSLSDLAVELEGSCQNRLVISMLAGVSVAKLQDALIAERVIRCMPNLPIKVGKGVTGWIASVEATNEDKKLAQKIFSSFGYQVKVSNENMLDVVTALSGSGPAYYFYLCQILTAWAREMGFNEEEARAIAENTFRGAAKLMEPGDMSSEDWVQAVASKGGTTEAALKSFAQDKLDEIVTRGLEEAKKKSKELSG
ncbi:pyrroline-5-carboxylate reductase [Patescibacteria group bacterium]|nr:pyrroline-5-carboxylate reductase [Patescibacteria group bacterium]